MKSRILAPVSALVCACCIAIGFTLMFVIKPPFLFDPELKLAMVHQHGGLLIIWYVVDWIVFGLSALLFSFAITESSQVRYDFKPLIINVTAIMFAAYCISIGLAEILTTLMQMSLNSAQTESGKYSLQLVFTLLKKLRSSTEFSGDIWLILVSIWMWFRTRVHKHIVLPGGMIGLLGIAILTPEVQFLAPLYVLLHSVWFFAVAGHLITLQRANVSPFIH